MLSTTIEPLQPPQHGNTIGFCTYLDACNAGAWKHKLETLFPHNGGAQFFQGTRVLLLFPFISKYLNWNAQQKTPISNNP